MNTDYLSIAQTTKNEFTFVANGGTVPAGGQVTRTGNFTVPKQIGAIDQIITKQDSRDYMLGYTSTVYKNSTDIGTITVYRTNSTNLRVDVTINNLFSSSSLTFPTMTFKIRVFSYKPPNVF